MKIHRLWPILWLGVVVVASGCNSVTPSASAVGKPLFPPTSEDVPRLAMFARQIDAKAASCMGGAKCEQVYFAKALVSLFENQEAAQALFRQVIEQSPASPLAIQSQLWLRLLENENGGVDFSPSYAMIAHFAREWMERQLSEDGSSENPALPMKIQREPIDQSHVVLGLQKQLRARDHQITLLRAQLQALKFIDEEQEKGKVRPPASLRAADHFLER